ncbi:MAG: hypothetical protein M1331_00450 [Candidatus Marsarchaeota archaeon]|nr:hypothetical protein [Candidatus Marsarchaeota archaeon]MCL5105856.1 hypothetical protein [Candidatus Marsarchaeota archaeon]
MAKAKQATYSSRRAGTYTKQASSAGNANLVLVLILTLFILFTLVFFKMALRIESILVSIANNTAGANGTRIENIYNNYHAGGNASVAVYISLPAGEIYSLRLSASKGNRTLESVGISNYGNNIYQQNQAAAPVQTPILASREYVAIFSGLEAFSEYNISISGTVRPYCTKICPLASSGGANSLSANAVHTGIIGAAANASTSSLTINAIGGFPLRNASNETSAGGALPSFILYIHKYEIVATGANNSVVNVTFSAI